MFSELVVAYLFLGGTGGGACAVCAVLGLLADGEDVRRGLAMRFREGDGWDECGCGGRGGCGGRAGLGDARRPAVYRRLFVPALAAALVVLALGMVCLAADLGRFDRVLLLAVSTPSNFLVLGFWALALCSALALAVLLVWQGVFSVRLGLLRALNGLLLAVALVTVAYTGLLLATIRAVPLWFGPWLPALFVLSGLSCGLALVMAVAVFSRSAVTFGRVMRGLAWADCACMVVEAVVLTAWLGSVWAAAGGTNAFEGAATPTDAAALASVALLVEGPLAPWFWGVLVGGGLALPLVAEVASLARRRFRENGLHAGASPVAASSVDDAPTLIAAACVLAGGAVLRWLVVAAAVQPVVSSMVLAL